MTGVMFTLDESANGCDCLILVVIVQTNKLAINHTSHTHHFVHNRQKK